VDVIGQLFLADDPYQRFPFCISMPLLIIQPAKKMPISVTVMIVPQIIKVTTIAVFIISHLAQIIA
jgi:hypothetical protein